MSLDYIKKGPKLSFDKLKSNLPSDIQFTWVDDKDVFHKVTPNHKFNPNKQYVMNGNEMDENGREIGYLYLCFTQQGKLFGGTSYGLNFPISVLQYLGFNKDVSRLTGDQYGIFEIIGNVLKLRFTIK